ncbi:Gp15 family bacteriophage protein [Mycoplasmopsis bovigenitalium]|uniref:Gp15 family bacteriophage protein n=1 Tax=Mycoplasmopsis bovigenitalium TaxID=2112 RepID=UPI000BBB6607
MDYIKDLDLIIPALKTQYNIEPNELLRLKAKTFLVYISALNDEHLLSKVIVARSNSGEDMSEEYKKLREIYKLNDKQQSDPLANFARSMTKKENIWQ